MLDIFRSNPAFNVVNLTLAINKQKFVPGRLGQLGIFGAGRGITTTTVVAEEKNGIFKLLSPTPRGAPGETVDKTKRKLRPLSVPHFEVNDAVYAEEVQGVRAFGSETELETVMGKVAERNRDVILPSFSATEEYQRIGAVKGIITYADGSTVSLFDAFEVSQPAEIDFDLDNANPVPGVLREKCAGVVRSMGAALEATPFSGIHAFCGDKFFDDLIKHPEVRATYLNQAAAAELRQGYVTADGQSWGSFEFGGIRWENYRGQVGSTKFVDDDKVHFIPLGAPGFFDCVYSPADYIETVNTMGRRLYARQYEMNNGKGVHYDVQMNALSYCTRPNALLRGKRT